MNELTLKDKIEDIFSEYDISDDKNVILIEEKDRKEVIEEFEILVKMELKIENLKGYNAGVKWATEQVGKSNKQEKKDLLEVCKTVLKESKDER